jgi:PmbA protein
LDLRSSRQIGMTTTGHASRTVSSVPSPSPSNVYLCPSETPVADLTSDIRAGFFATELIGFGVNGVTGDYSRGASGFWIENGSIAFPVSELTISGNLIDMFANMTVADDLEYRYGMDSPSVRVDGMTVAGQ